jgi:hypothetical protein
MKYRQLMNSNFDILVYNYIFDDIEAFSFVFIGIVANGNSVDFCEF